MTAPQGVSYPEGVFSWMDLTSTDMEGSKAFYTQLMGWDAEDTPLGGGQFYTTFKLNGKSVAGGGNMQPEQREQGMPSYWGAYVNVDSADAIAAKAEAAGATVILPPMDVMEEGRMAIIQDPTGAIFGTWQPGNHKGAEAINTTGALVWTELMTPDPDAAGKFYNAVFGWDTEAGAPTNEGTPYIMFKLGEQPVGGLFQMGPGLAEVPPNWTTYLGVEDCDAALEKAKSLGGTPLTEPIDTFAGRLVVVRDPQGAVFNLIAMAPPPQ